MARVGITCPLINQDSAHTPQPSDLTYFHLSEQVSAAPACAAAAAAAG